MAVTPNFAAKDRRAPVFCDGPSKPLRKPRSMGYRAAAKRHSIVAQPVPIDAGARRTGSPVRQGHHQIRRRRRPPNPPLRLRLRPGTPGVGAVGVPHACDACFGPHMSPHDRLAQVRTPTLRHADNLESCQHLANAGVGNGASPAATRNYGTLLSSQVKPGVLARSGTSQHTVRRALRACKSLIAGSIPVPASRTEPPLTSTNVVRGGRRSRLRSAPLPTACHHEATGMVPLPTVGAALCGRSRHDDRCARGSLRQRGSVGGRRAPRASGRRVGPAPRAAWLRGRPPRSSRTHP